MKRKSRYRRKRRRSRFPWIIAVIAGIIAIGIVLWMTVFGDKNKAWTSPEELLIQYLDHIPKREYEEMYAMLNVEASGSISQEDFTARNSAIYEGIEVQNMKAEITSYDEEKMTVTYQISFDTIAGTVSFENKAFFLKGEERYELVWDDSLIFPELGSADKVKVSTTQAKRGDILDRNGYTLAGEGTASSAGIVPGKLENREEAIEQIVELLETTPEDIEKKLSAKWVKDDYFVPIKTIPKVEEIELMVAEPDAEIRKEQERQEKLLAIPGVMLSDVEVREYPLGEAAAHLVGYVQNVTAEDLEQHEGEGYTAGSVIGRNGIEGLFEKELKGQNGCRIYIVDSEGKEKQELASRMVEHGQTIQLTIDAGLQTSIYEQFKDDKSCSVAMDPYTGEVLALVSTPSYDSNDFIMGLSAKEWETLNEDENKPLYNRFRQTWCPGSSFKPVTAAIGLDSSAIDPEEDYGNEGLRWQKDSSWGSYYVTTLHDYDPVILENALIYSDNIYFAKAALKIGAEKLETSLKELGFLEELPFEIKMQKTQYSNSENIETEIQLADSGYGQGQMLVNPLHMACIYSAFCNDGNVIKPYLLYRKEEAAEYWIPQAFSVDTAGRVLEGLKKVVNDPHGTGYAAHMDEISLAGKTGTAEIKASKDDTSGTELGWFAVFTAEETQNRPILLVSMTEDVKGRGGSGYVVGKDRAVLEQWFYPGIARLEADMSDSMETRQRMVSRLGENGYAAVDSENQVDMAEAEQVLEFCKAVDEKKNDRITIIVTMETGLRKFDLETEDGHVNIVEGYYQYDSGGELQNRNTVSYPADLWKFTEDGYLIFEGSYFSDENYVLTLSDAREHTALRVFPLDETCREWNRKYILPVGYKQNNMFLIDWKEEDFGDLDFYDIFDIFYPTLYKQRVPFAADENFGVSTVYKIPEEVFEAVIMMHFNIDKDVLRSKTTYLPEEAAYEYRPRGFYEAEYPDIPYPEVVSCTENQDGTITLIIHAVYPNENTSMAYSHRTVIRPLDEDHFQYVSNQMISLDEEQDLWWHSDRLKLDGAEGQTDTSEQRGF